MSRTASPESKPPEALSGMQLETELYRALPEARPVGKHKHIVIIKLQDLIYERTRHRIPVEELWDMLGELYDLEALDEMASSSSISIPSSPDPLSPLIRNSRSLSPLSSANSSPAPSAPASKSRKGRPSSRPGGRRSKGGAGEGRRPSRSAAVIDSKHFERSFALPALGLPESDPEERDKWTGMVLARAEVPGGEPDWGGKSEAEMRAESRSPRKPALRPDDAGGVGDGEGDEGSGAEGGAGAEREEEEGGGEGEEEQGRKPKKPTRQYGKQQLPVSATSRSSRRTSGQSAKGRKDKDGSSSLSEDDGEGGDAEEDAEEGAEEEAQVVTGKRKGRVGPGKRKRESGSTAHAASDSDDRSPVKPDRRRKSAR